MGDAEQAKSPDGLGKRPGKVAVGTSGKAVEKGHEARDEPTEDGSDVLNEVADRLGFRDFLRRHRGLDVAYRAIIAVLGTLIVLGGIVLIPLPGPGWLIVFAGLALLATEFAWAARLLHFARDKVRAWTDWVRRQSLAVRGLIGLLGLACVVGAVMLYAQVQGVPDWVPLIG
jgi:uncharacterized protein (TIGR02611 family)